MNRERTNTGIVICCPQCGKTHRFNDNYVDEIVNCECGFEFYAFAMGYLHLALPAVETRYDPIARAMRRFVVSTGRCGDIPPELYIDQNGQERFDMTAQEIDSEEELSRILDEYQTETFGRCYVTKDIIDSICDSLAGGKDIELKKQKDGIDIIELKKKRVNIKKQESRRLSSYTQLTADLMKSGVLFRTDQ